MQSLDWPNRVVRFVVPFASGGPTDIVARVVTEQLSKIWGQQVVIENRGGAGTNIGNEMVARSDPDGYTVLFATASLAVNRSLYRSLSYDPFADFAAVSLVSRFSLFMFVPNSLPTKSVMEFVAYAKAHPGKLTLASPGTGSTPHLAGELLKQMAGIEMTHVPYRGASPALNDLIPGRVDSRKHAVGPAAWTCGYRRQTRSRGTGIAHDGRGRRSGLRGIVVARLVRAGQDAA